jgi:hypothetical protein
MSSNPSIDVDALLKAGATPSKKAMCYKLVDTFAGIVERKLWLKDARDGQAKTNGHLIETPFNNPRAYQLTEHELSHILFESDATARAMFEQEYAKKIAQVAQKGGVRDLDERVVRKAINFVTGVLDDERVISLWGLLYEGSEAIMRRMKHDESQPFIGDVHESLMTLLYVTAGGHDVEDGKLDRYHPYMVEALRKVRRRDYFGVLVASKWLITQLVGEIVRESRGLPPPSQGSTSGLQGSPDDQNPAQGSEGTPSDQGDSDASQGSTSGLQGSPDDQNPAQGSEGTPSDQGDSDASQAPCKDDDQGEQPTSGDQSAEKGTGDAGDEGNGQGGGVWEPPDDASDAGLRERSKALDDMVSKLQVPREARKQVEDVTESKFKKRGQDDRARSMANAAIGTDVKNGGPLEKTLDRSSRRMRDTVVKARNAARNALTEDDRTRREAFAKVIFHDVDTSTVKDAHVAVNIPPEDQETIRRLRATFIKVMGRRTNILEDTGIEVDVPSVIQRRLTGEPLPVFRTEKQGRGFKALILIDRSSSMAGSRTKSAERACRIVNRALKFPFVKSDVWGFQSWKNGEVDITRFQSGAEIFSSSESEVGGTTPIHTAIRVAIRQLEEGDERKHLFVISDGWPVFQARDGSLWNTGSLMSFVRMNVNQARSKGIGVTGVLIGRDMNSKGMQFMFGPPKYWRLVNDKSFGNDLIQLVTKSFVDYLRGG